jgi:alpha-ketoglutarate-dependent 2,4-dichlorophenoxyacetate dioxygenase
LSDISNLDENGEIMASDDRRRMYVLGNRLWHTDASFQDPPGRYSMLHARVLPPVPLTRSSPTCGPRTTRCPPKSRGDSPTCPQLADAGRRSLYLASHASRIIDWQIPEGRLFLRDLIEHATRDEFTYTHSWSLGDLVIWDNRATMHRGFASDDTKYRRELRRVTTLDHPRRELSAASMAAAATS